MACACMARRSADMACGLDFDKLPKSQWETVHTLRFYDTW